MMHGLEKSDPVVVAMKPANNADVSAAEWVEPRTGTKGNADQPRTRRTQSRGSVSPGLERVRQVARQRKKEKFYALHAPEVECISKGKARNPYEFGVKVSLAVTHKHGLMVGARSFPGNPYDGHILSAQLEQTTNLLQDLGRAPKQAIVDLGYRGVDADNPGVQIIHRGKTKSLSEHDKRLLKHRQVIEPLIGHTKADHRMDRCWLQGALGDALHALSCAVGYNIRWLLRAIARLGLQAAFCALSGVIVCLACLMRAMPAWPTALGSAVKTLRSAPPPDALPTLAVAG